MENGTEIKLTGDQIKFIRLMTGQTQKEFGDRFAISQVTVGRLESSRQEECSGPEIILIKIFAEKYGINIPDIPVSRDILTGELKPVSAQ
jgi:transcriptional regulator with XRE-family HTH domain